MESGETEGSNHFVTVMGILILAAVILGALAAWRSSRVFTTPPTRAGLTATLNSETTDIINNSVLYERYRAYTGCSINLELAILLGEDLGKATPAQKPDLERQSTEAIELAAMNQIFFPPRYLEIDGTYNTRRELGERRAEAGLRLDLDPEPHFASIGPLHDKQRDWMIVLMVIALSLVMYTVAQGLHPIRRLLRYAFALGGTSALVAAAVVMATLV